MPSPPTSARILVVAEFGLVGEAVSRALRTAGLEVRRLAWSAEAPRRRSLRRATRGLLLSDLGSETAIAGARRLIEEVDVAWVVLTGAGPGPAVGAVLEAGAAEVLSPSSTLAEVAEVLRRPGPEHAMSEWRRLVNAWLRQQRVHDEGARRLRQLSPREDEVLELLYRGEPVAQIAQRFDVSPATVRSQVKSLLAKLGVSSQLAAVAMYSEHGDPTTLALPQRGRRHPQFQGKPLMDPKKSIGRSKGGALGAARGRAVRRHRAGDHERRGNR